MSTSFPGFPKQALTFFRQLSKNNKREWFQPRKALFEEHVRGPMLELIGLIADDMRTYAADYAVEPKKAIYRIYRDTRFAKDKTPYKPYVAAMYFCPGVPKNTGAGFYFSVSDKTVEIAAGAYMPSPEELLAIRNAIAADNGKALKKITSPPSVRKVAGDLQGATLARVPKGFDADHPAAELLRMKQFYFDITLPADVALKPSIRKEITSRFRMMALLVHYLNGIILASQRDEDDAGETIPKRPAPMF